MYIMSVCHGHVNVMKLLLDYNANIQAVDSVSFIDNKHIQLMCSFVVYDE